MSAYIWIANSKKRAKNKNSCKRYSEQMITQKRKTIAPKLSANERNGIMFVASFVCIRRNVQGHRLFDEQFGSMTFAQRKYFAEHWPLTTFSALWLDFLDYICALPFASIAFAQHPNAVGISITSSKAIQKLIKSMRSLRRWVWKWAKNWLLLRALRFTIITTLVKGFPLCSAQDRFKAKASHLRR